MWYSKLRSKVYVLCTSGEFVWNEGGVVPATCTLYHESFSSSVSRSSELFSSGMSFPTTAVLATSRFPLTSPCPPQNSQVRIISISTKKMKVDKNKATHLN